MNVQQINNSGKDIRVFAVTAAVLVILAISGWGLLNAFQKQWSSRAHEKEPIGRRFTYVISHISSGRIWWMISSGLLLGLMTDGRYGFRGPKVPSRFKGIPSHYCSRMYEAGERIL